MRIAISGFHPLGKSTLEKDWIAAHPNFIPEDEPYRALRAWYPIEFRKRPRGFKTAFSFTTA